MDGALAQLGERLLCKHQVIGSIPIGSTTFRNTPEMKTRYPARCAGHAGAIPPLFDIVNGFLIDAVAHWWFDYGRTMDAALTDVVIWLRLSSAPEDNAGIMQACR